MRPVETGNFDELYIALETEREEQQVLQSLSTDIMRWTGDVWIVDLSRYHEYWQKQAGGKGLNPLGLWRQLLNCLLGEEPADSESKVISLSPAYRACCAHNPWSAVLLLQAMRERGVRGMISLQSRIGQSLFAEISWTTWWQQIDILEKHFSHSRIKGYKQASFRQQCKRLQLAVPRLDFKRPRAMQILNRPGVKKRFGETLASIWNWTYGEQSSNAWNIYQTSFPWQSWRFGDPPRTRRNLDYPLLIWEQFVPLLVEDFDKLRKTIRNSGEKVIRIDWTLTFEDMMQLTVPILFRNPHNLQEETGKHMTSLLQANYGFVDAVAKRFPHDPENGNCDTMPLVVAWELEITASLYLPDLVLDIFGEGQEKGKDLEILMRLENELPVGLNRFSSRGDWFPEDSFAEEHFVSEEIVSPDAEMIRSLEALAEERPLFIRRTPQPVEKMEEHSSIRFLESTMSKWWKGGANREKERNYFKHIDPEGNALWVFKDTAGQWYQHGIFG